MKRLTAALLAVGLASSSAAAFAQSTNLYPSNGYNDGYQNNRYQNNGYQQGQTYTDYARVIRVDPVIDGRYNTASTYSGQRCYETQSAGGYQSDGYYNGGYRNEGYRNDGYRDPYGNSQVGTNTGRTVATVLGGIAGAVLGSKVGGGSGAYATTAIGSMVGGMAGRQVYDRVQQNRNVRPGVVTVCDPEPVGNGYAGGYTRTSDGRASAYDVTYEYNGRRYTRRMNYHPGDRVQVRVEVSPQ